MTQPDAPLPHEPLPASDLPPAAATAMAPSPKDTPVRGGILRSSAIYSGLTLVSRFLGLARDLVITSRLGASQTIAADAYYTALTFPNLFRRMFAEGAFAASFVPDYSRRLAADGKEAADAFAADALATMAALMIGLTVLCQLAMPWIMYAYSYGYGPGSDKFKLTVILTQITMPYLPCMVIASLFSGVLQARGRFIVYGLYPTLLNVIMLAAVLPQHEPIQAAYAASWAVIVAGVAQALLCWWGARHAGARISLRSLHFGPDIRAMLKRMAPGMIASSATQINLFISAILASQVNGMRVWLNVAERFYQLPLSLVGVAIGVALLPQLSKAMQLKDQTDTRQSLDQALVFGLALSLPASAALMGMPGLPGFVAEIQIFMGLWQASQTTSVLNPSALNVQFAVVAIVAVISIVINAAWTLRVAGRIYFSEPQNPQLLALPRLDALEKFAIVFMCAILLIVGTMPNTVMGVVQSGVQSIMQTLMGAG